ncbi:hypothetical protein LIN78_17830 [Leeia sp. TBRC 13508]|uniref:Uncharacterized protein n=1 Tax=Leeia speluncae TaxID=2884804 RepID=A0ABS8DB25_9NEIS|nr:phage/plasmid replication protein [Leeia speluncae]MCB6185410.1 hypothetical protein [Leeia speluncae]
MIEPFCDWLDIEQTFDFDIPVMRNGFRQDVSNDGEIIREKGYVQRFRGSYDTSLSIVSDGRTLKLSGNIGRFGRPDNLFGYSLVKCIELASDFVQSLGFPRFSSGYDLARVFNSKSKNASRDGYTGAQIKRVDFTSNFQAQSAEESRIFSTLSGWQLHRQERLTKLYPHGVTYNEGSNRWYFKLYNKSYESGLYPAQPDKPDYKVFKERENFYFYARAELSLRYKWLKEKNLHRIDAWTNEGLQIEEGAAPMTNIIDLSIYNKFTGQLKRAEHIATPANLFDCIPTNLAKYGRMYFDGHDIKQIVSEATFYRIKKQLIEYGIDISRPMNVERLPMHFNIIEFTPVQLPAEFSRLRNERPKLMAVA